MAVLVMAETPHNNKTDCKKEDGHGGNTIFHDFFGTTICASDSAVKTQRTDLSGDMKLPEASSASSAGGGHGHVSATSDLGSGERQMKNHFQGVPVHSLNGDFSGTESSNKFLGRKRSNSDSAFMGLGPRDQIPKIGSESLESLHLMKMLRSNVVEENPRRSHDEELAFGMQLTRANSTSHHISQPPPSTKCDSVPTKWERSLSNVGALAQYPSRFGQYATYPDKLSSRDSKAGPSIISPPAADEGSRTGKKGSGIFSAINATNGVERHTSEVLISSQRPNSGLQSGNPESSDSPRERGSKSASRQMTIFYGGQAHVFDEVPPNKADVIMALAGSNGGSWSTSYAPKPSLHPSPNEMYIPNRENGPGLRNVAQEQHGRLTIPGKPVHRFTQGGPVSATTGDPLNTVSVGGHLGSITLRPARSFNQPAESNRKEKHEV